MPQRRRCAGSGSAGAATLFRPDLRYAGEKEIRGAARDCEAGGSLLRGADSGDRDRRRRCRKRARSAFCAGAAGIAAIRMFQEATDPAALQRSGRANSRVEASQALSAEPAADRLPAFDVVADTLMTAVIGNRENQPHRAPEPAPEEQSTWSARAALSRTRQPTSAGTSRFAATIWKNVSIATIPMKGTDLVELLEPDQQRRNPREHHADIRHQIAEPGNESVRNGKSSPMPRKTASSREPESIPPAPCPSDSCASTCVTSASVSFTCVRSVERK